MSALDGFVPVHEPLTRFAKESPGRIFLVDPEVSYGALDQSSLKLAQAFREAHLAVGDRVVIWCGKGHLYVEAILATLKAGGAYVPLDPNQPIPRVKAIIGDAEPAVLVTEKKRFAELADGLPSTVRLVVLTDGEPSDVAGKVTSRKACVEKESAAGLPMIHPGDVGAILYTSGSTGIPKGVRLSHLNLANFIDWAREEQRFSPDDVFSNHASFNFDLSTFDTFGALSVGAKLWVISEQISGNVSALVEGIKRHKISVWYSVPSILALMVTSGAFDKAAAAGLRVVNFAGEVYPIARLRELKAVLSDEVLLYNLYGPTETNVCTYYRVRKIAEDRAIPVPVGYAITGAELKVVDNDGKEVTGEEIGELLVSGTVVTPGYWRRVDPRNAENHLRGMHATGDLVSRDEEGALVYRGRKDRMVKLDGFRVELGEIESALLAHPSVREAAVVYTLSEQRPKLTAFYSHHEGAQELNLLDVKRHCSQRLPRYMVPHAARPMPALPKNPNGKIDYPKLTALVSD